MEKEGKEEGKKGKALCDESKHVDGFFLQANYQRFVDFTSTLTATPKSDPLEKDTRKEEGKE